MKNMMRSGRRGYARGFSLVELMVSLVIGLVVVGAVLVSYIASGQTNKRQAAYAEMNENAQLAMSILQHDVLLAGYAQAIGASAAAFNRTYSGNAVFGCDTGFTTPNTSGGMTSVDCAASGTPAIEINYESDITNSVPTGGGLPSDCLGIGLNQQTVNVTGAVITFNPSPPIATGNTTAFYVTRNRYYLATGSTGRSELHCASSRTPAQPGQPLVDNVEGIQIWYGEAGADPRQIVRYVNASGVNNWAKIISVRICLLMRSSEPLLTGEDVTAGMSGYLGCGSTAQTSADRYLRRAYFSTTTLRNKMAL